MGFKLAGILMIVMAVMVAGGYWYYNDTQERIAILTENNAKLQTAVATNEETINSLQADYAKIQETNSELNDKFANIRKQNSVLSDKLSKHDLGVLGANKPGLVERVINGASAKAGRCFELISGAELTEKETNAKSAKSFNSECPWLYDDYIESGRLQSTKQPEASGN
jgi:cell division protein FtsB